MPLPFFKHKRKRITIVLASAAAEGADNQSLPTTDAEQQKRRYAVKPPVHPDQYGPRQDLGEITFYDLAVDPDGTPWDYRIVQNYTILAADGDPTTDDELLILSVADADWTAYSAAVIARFAAESFKQVERESSYLLNSDVIFYTDDADAAPKFYALTEPGKRVLISDSVFIVDVSDYASGEKWTDENILKVKPSKPNLRFNSLAFFEQFDTGNTVDFKITATDVYTDPAVSLPISGAASLKIYLAPTMQPLACYVKNIGGTLLKMARGILRPFPRELINPIIFPTTTYGTTGGYGNDAGIFFPDSGQETALGTIMTNVMAQDGSVDRSFDSPVPTGGADRSMTVTTYFGGNGDLATFQRQGNIPFRNAAATAAELRTNYPKAGTIAAIIEKGSDIFYIWHNRDYTPDNPFSLSSAYREAEAYGIFIYGYS